MDHPQFDDEILDKGTKAILRTRDGKLRAAVPNPLGSCAFLNDVEIDELCSALHKHKQVMKEYPRNGEGVEAFVDASDTGYTLNHQPVEAADVVTNGLAKLSVLNDDSKSSNGTNGIVNGNGHIKCAPEQTARMNASGPQGVNGLANGKANGVNGHVNGLTNGEGNGVNGHVNGEVNGHAY